MQFMSIPEVAKQLNVTRQRGYQLAAEGRIPCTRMGRRIIVPRTAWDRWCREQIESALAHTKGTSEGPHAA